MVRCIRLGHARSLEGHHGQVVWVGHRVSSYVWFVFQRLILTLRATRAKRVRFFRAFIVSAVLQAVHWMAPAGLELLRISNANRSYARYRVIRTPRRAIRKTDIHYRTRTDEI